jgi:hypothetical protein
MVKRAGMNSQILGASKVLDLGLSRFFLPHNPFLARYFFGSFQELV